MGRGRQHGRTRRPCRSGTEERFIEITGSHAVQNLSLGVALANGAVRSNQKVVRDRDTGLEPRRLRLVVAHAESIDDGGVWIGEHGEMYIAARRKRLQHLGRVIGNGSNVDALGLKITASGFKVDKLRLAERAPIGRAVEEDQQPVWAGEGV